VLCDDALANASDGGMVAFRDRPDGVAEIAQEMPAVGGLHRRRCPLTRPIGIGASAVSGDDLDRGVRIPVIMITQSGGS